VSPANDFANLAPRHINFRTGGYITGLLGILIFPWKLIADPHGYIFTWLIAYSSLLGPIGGIMIVDYFFVRRQQLVVADLFRLSGQYRYRGGLNPAALAALLAGILPNVPGFLTQTGLLGPDVLWPWVTGIYNYAWFVGFFLSGTLYYVLMQKPARVYAPQQSETSKVQARVSTH
jgi:NCS1 family nucleobase:cation symporter-1